MYGILQYPESLPSLTGVLHALGDAVNRHDQGVFKGYSLFLRTVTSGGIRGSALPQPLHDLCLKDVKGVHIRVADLHAYL